METQYLPESRHLYLYTADRDDDPPFEDIGGHIQLYPEGIIVGWKLHDDVITPMSHGCQLWPLDRQLIFYSENRTGLFSPDDVVQMIDQHGDPVGIWSIRQVTAALMEQPLRRA